MSAHSYGTHVSYFGMAGGSDETSKFLDLREHAIAKPGTVYVFDPIEYRSATPKWLDSVHDVTIMAHGSSFRNLGAGTYGYSDMDCAVYIGSGSLFHDNQGAGQLDPSKVNNGHLIADTAVGADAVYFMISNHSAEYEIGDAVLLYWFERQSNTFPPNPAFFEYNEVSGVGLGYILLKTPTRYAYRSEAPDNAPNPIYGTVCGKARCLNLNRSGYKVSKKIRWHGGVGVNTGNATNPGFDGVLEIAGVLDCEVRDAQFEGIFPTMCGRVRVSNSRFTGLVSELDKITDDLYLIDVDVNNLSQGTGVKQFSMLHGKLTGSAQIRAKRIALDGVDIHSQGAASGFAQVSCDAFARDIISIRNCGFYPTSNQLGAVQPGNTIPFTPDGVTNTSMTINAGNGSLGQVKTAIDIGSIITLGAGAVEIFIVEDITFDSSGNMILSGRHSIASHSLSAARNLWTTKTAIWGDGNIIHNRPQTYRDLRQGRSTWSQCFGGSPPCTVRRSITLNAGSYQGLNLNCFITRITVDIAKAYSGDDASATLALSNQGLGGTFLYMQCNVKNAGLRRIDNFGTNGARTGDLKNGGGALDAAAAIPVGTWCEELILHLRGDGGVGAFTDAETPDLPVIRVMIEGHKPI